MSASTRIPPIALPFVSDRAKKTLDLVILTLIPSLLPHPIPLPYPDLPWPMALPIQPEVHWTNTFLSA